MGKRQKSAIKFILSNKIIIEKLSDAIGCPKDWGWKKRRKLVAKWLKRANDDNDIEAFDLPYEVIAGKKDKSFSSIADMLEVVNKEGLINNSPYTGRLSLTPRC